MTRLKSLGGSILDAISLDLVHQSAVLEISVTSSGATSYHRLEFLDLGDLRFVNRIPGPWNYAEFTEIHAARTPDGRLKAEVLLWGEDASLEFVAGTANLDGVPLELADLE